MLAVLGDVQSRVVPHEHRGAVGLGAHPLGVGRAVGAPALVPRLVVLAQAVQEQHDVARGVAEGLRERPARDGDVGTVDTDRHRDGLRVVQASQLVADHPVDRGHDPATEARRLDRAAHPACGQRADRAAGDPQHAADGAVDRRGHGIVQRLGDTTTDDPGGAERPLRHRAVHVAHGTHQEPVAVLERERRDIGGPGGIGGHVTQCDNSHHVMPRRDGRVVGHGPPPPTAARYGAHSVTRDMAREISRAMSRSAVLSPWPAQR